MNSATTATVTTANVNAALYAAAVKVGMHADLCSMQVEAVVRWDAMHGKKSVDITWDAEVLEKRKEPVLTAKEAAALTRAVAWLRAYAARHGVLGP